MLTERARSCRGGFREGASRAVSLDELRAGARPLHPHRRRAAHQQFPALAARLHRALFHRRRCGRTSTPRALDAAIASYRERERRFGRTSEQLARSRRGRSARVSPAGDSADRPARGHRRVPLHAQTALLTAAVLRAAARWRRMFLLPQCAVGAARARAGGARRVRMGALAGSSRSAACGVRAGRRSLQRRLPCCSCSGALPARPRTSLHGCISWRCCSGRSSRRPGCTSGWRVTSTARAGRWPAGSCSCRPGSPSCCCRRSADAAAHAPRRRLDRRHRGVFRRPALRHATSSRRRSAPARPGKASSARLHRGARLRHSAIGCRRCSRMRSFYDRAGGCWSSLLRADGAQHRRRSVRVLDQAPGRREGQRRAAAGPRRRARPHRQR